MKQAAAVDSPRIPGEAGVWILIFGDLLVFSLFFGTFAWYRMQQPALFLAEQARMVQGFGLVNTMLLLTSSLLVVLALTRSRARQGAAARRCMSGAIALGAGFVVVKFFEYREKIGHGLLPSNNDFLMLYFTFTGIHLLHVIIGLGALTWMRSRIGEPLSPRMTGAVESVGIFWHLIDILWVVLFAIFYLHR